ncbi:TIGR04283 family arsenosugar biosynthesis glycosyltransferase [Synechococcus sp. CCY 9618]|uniref:TIGR04283 family arsenosugar biosynthesis glycosyltransferase n=1 Tax=Synechococcus sp. CCY 9618 TaxID=2815602 RepID=UPI001C23CAD7|nr:TIGR04283 family arsenosugar biosynthesis glycosyltransferase [Synechococcus sp. CCY 9618]
MTPPLSVVIAARDEAGCLPSLLADLATAPALVRQVLVVDGGSSDGTPHLAALAGAEVIHMGGGRGRQLAIGVARSTAPWLLLLHGDVRLPPGWASAVTAAIRAGEESAWAFRLRIDAGDPALRLVELAVALRSRWRQLPYGDQGLLLARALHDGTGGIAPLPLMEDLEFMQRLRLRARVRSLAPALRVNGRRWQRLGVWQTVLANARLRRDWRRGTPAEELAARYYPPAVQGAYQKAQRRWEGSSSQP